MAEKKSALTKHRLDLIVYACICVGVILTVSLLNHYDIFKRLEFDAQDTRFRIRGPEAHSDKIAIVAIDPATLETLGIKGVPPRYYHVQLIDNLYKAGARAVLLDILFLTYTGEQDRETLLDRPSLQDSLLADVIRRHPNTVIARKQIVTMEQSTGNSTGEPPLPKELFRNPKQLAFVDMYHDSDSYVRRTKLITSDMPGDNGWNYSFALKAVMFALNADTAWVDTKARTVHVADRKIPLDADSTMIINFCMDEQTYTEVGGGYISYQQVLDDQSEYGLKVLMEKGTFKDKVVLVGATFPESKDWEFTPFYLGSKVYSKSEYPMFGVHVHKQIASSIINGRFIPPISEWQVILLIIFMALLSTVINYRFRGFGGLAFSLLLIVLYTLLAVALFLTNRLMLPLVAPAFATVIVNYISVVTWNFLSERRQKAQIRGAFSHYVPGKVVSELLKNPEMLKLGGEERVMTVIFSDVAGFTTISEKLTPTQLVELLNEYLTAMTDIVLARDGIIDKYEGDAIMAEFGAPLPDDQHAVKACYAALDMQEKLADLRVKLKAEGRPELNARVGINSGPMVIGNMGSREIFDYTVMGDNVNLSSRLEGANKVYDTRIMCSENTRKLVDQVIITRELDLIRVKGKTEGIRIHEVVARRDRELDDTRKRLLETYLRGLEAYKDRRWEEGIARFRAALEIDPNDGPSKLYLGRCKEFLENPPDDNWDGIFTMRTK